MQPGPCSRHQERCIEMLKVMRSVSWKGKEKIKHGKAREIRDASDCYKENEISNFPSPDPSDFNMGGGH